MRPLRPQHSVSTISTTSAKKNRPPAAPIGEPVSDGFADTGSHSIRDVLRVGRSRYRPVSAGEVAGAVLSVAVPCLVSPSGRGWPRCVPRSGTGCSRSARSAAVSGAVVSPLDVYQRPIQVRKKATARNVVTLLRNVAAPAPPNIALPPPPPPKAVDNPPPLLACRRMDTTKIRHTRICTISRKVAILFP